MEIKKQITGMRRLLNDSTGRIYQRVGKEGEKLKEEPQDLDSVWPPRLNSTAEAPQSLHPSSRGAWNELPPSSGQFSGQYGTRSRTFQSQPHTTGSSNGMVYQTLRMLGACSGPCRQRGDHFSSVRLRCLKPISCLFFTAGAQNRQQPPISLMCSQRTAASRKRNKKKKVPPKTVEPLPVKQKAGVLGTEKPAVASEQSGPPAAEHPSPGDSRVLGFGIVLESPASDPEVQLAEGFDVFMPKSQLDSILSNYTRSGSLLFRKLVCAFFDDKTLANSLPNGKRKRGLNDNRKGLDQNIVGAIKVFTEKYCTANHVDKLPGPRDWVQILQDQIKLARRRLKRGSAEAADGDERLDGISLPPTGIRASQCLVLRDIFTLSMKSSFCLTPCLLVSKTSEQQALRPWCHNMCLPKPAAVETSTRAPTAFAAEKRSFFVSLPSRPCRDSRSTIMKPAGSEVSLRVHVSCITHTCGIQSYEQGKRCDRTQREVRANRMIGHWEIISSTFIYPLL
ncbi:ben domain-containing protein 7 [Lynx pardinus]|nr:ben domain-containing protein 7 [Lynx pardinus]